MAFSQGENRKRRKFCSGSPKRSERRGGVETRILNKIDNIKYFFVKEGQKIFKTVTFYLMEYIQEAEGGFCWETEEIAWLSFEEAKERLAFSNEKKILEKANLALEN